MRLWHGVLSVIPNLQKFKNRKVAVLRQGVLPELEGVSGYVGLGLLVETCAVHMACALVIQISLHGKPRLFRREAVFSITLILHYSFASHLQAPGCSLVRGSKTCALVTGRRIQSDFYFNIHLPCRG